MQLLRIKTPVLWPPKDDLYRAFDKSLPKLREGDVLIITSKVLAIHQGRTVKMKPGLKKDRLIAREAESYIPRAKVPGRHAVLTITNHALLPSAGIDGSNGNGYYILLPKKPENEAKRICLYLRKKYHLKKLGVIITDSHSVPLRHGVVGISLGSFGFEPLREYTRSRGVFGARLKVARANVVDALAATGTLLMGEAGERTPMVIARGADFLTFTDKPNYKSLLTLPGEDLYEPLLRAFRKFDKNK